MQGGNILLLLLLLLPPASANIQPGDLSVLHDIQNSLNNSKILSWPNNTDPCTGWQGITCDGAGHVVGIHLPNSGLLGSLPPTISSLQHLQKINLMNNSFIGALPSFHGMSSVQHIYLNNNQFRSIPDDFFKGLKSAVHISLSGNPLNMSSGGWTLPEDFASSAEILQLLDLSNCNLVGGVPAFLGSMKTLRRLVLSFNFLSGPIPRTFKGSSIAALLFSDNRMLSGTIDVITTMTNLQIVTLSRNQFSGIIPDKIGECKKLRILLLESNLLVGMVPPSLGTLDQLQSLNLEGNNLIGPLPVFKMATVTVSMYSFCSIGPRDTCSSEVMALLYFLAEVHYPTRLATSWTGNFPCKGWIGVTCVRGKVSVLSLPGFSLNGTISKSLSNLTRLLEIRLNNNQLVGHIPDSLTNLSSLQKLDLSWNDLTGPLPQFSTEVKVNLTGNANFNEAATGGNKGKKSKMIAISVAAGAAAFLLILMCIAIYKYRAVKQQKKEIQMRSTASKDLQLPFFSFETLADATGNFSDSNVLGKGGFGKVYKGLLQNGDTVAVKRLSEGSGQGIEQLKNEVNLIAKLQHRNLVRVLGHCIDGEEKLIVYEYLPNKSLDFFLFDATRKAILNWRTRLTIIKGIARGLLYLHEDSSVKIVHRDLKSPNILLDSEMIPKISDFGMAKIVDRNQQDVNTNRVAGTFGYMSPEYALHGEVSVKLDIYSFGVLVLEIISGEKAISSRRSNFSVIEHAWKLWDEGKASEFVDCSVLGSCPFNEAIRCIQLGLLCVQDNPDDRPAMPSIMRMLENENAVLPAPKRSAMFPPENGEGQSSQNQAISVDEETITLL